jgi:hypothetical protein
MEQMSGDKAKYPEPDPRFDPLLSRSILLEPLMSRTFFQILREDFLPPFRGRKKQHKRPRHGILNAGARKSVNPVR